MMRKRLWHHMITSSCEVFQMYEDSETVVTCAVGMRLCLTFRFRFVYCHSVNAHNFICSSGDGSNISNISTFICLAVCCRSCFWAHSCSWPWIVRGASPMGSGWPLVSQRAVLSYVLFLNWIHDFRSVSKFGLHLLLLLLPLDPWFWMLCANDMRWLRNQVVAPLTEELVFRACMLPMLVPCAGPSTAIITCPLFFGVGECKFFPA